MKGKYTDEFIASREFLNTYEWRKVRMEALVKHGNKCMCCNRTPEGEYYTCVDHIKPRKTHPHLALDIDNLQILCNVCNHGKGNWDSTDWREGNELVFTITKEWIDNNIKSYREDGTGYFTIIEKSQADLQGRLVCIILWFRIKEF